MKTENTRPLAERITHGPMKFEVASQTMGNFRTETCYIQKEGTFNEVARIHAGVDGSVMHQSLADASLIVEAFNVTRETGRTPRQLADERAELIAALKDCRNNLRDLWAIQFKGTPPQNDTLDHATETLNRLNS